MGRLDIVLVAILGSKIIKNHWILKVFVNNHVFEKYKVWSSIFDSFWIDFGSQMEPKRDKNWYQKSIEKVIGFWIDFWRPPGAATLFGWAAGVASLGGAAPPKAIS